MKVEYGGCHRHYVHTTRGVCYMYDSKRWYRCGGKNGKPYIADDNLAAKLNAFMVGKWYNLNIGLRII